MTQRIMDEAWEWYRRLEAPDAARGALRATLAPESAGDEGTGHGADQDPAADWEGFTLWLEADPAHREAYDAILLLNDALDRRRDALAAILPVEEIVPEVSVTIRRWAPWMGGAVAAALALVVAVPMMNPAAPESVSYQTGAGESRPVRLADGSTVTLGPSSTLIISGAQQDRLRLRGGAWFDIRHDPGRTMTIDVGDQQIRDIGTRFDLLALPGHVYVAVAQGSLSVGPGSGATNRIALSAGRSLAIDTRTHDAQLATIATGDVGSWRSGRLVYDNAPLALVAEDISRYGRRRVIVAPDMAQRRFSGVLSAGKSAHPAEELGNQLGALMGLEVRTEGDQLRLGAGAR